MKYDIQSGFKYPIKDKERHGRKVPVSMENIIDKKLYIDEEAGPPHHFVKTKWSPNILWEKENSAFLEQLFSYSGDIVSNLWGKQVKYTWGEGTVLESPYNPEIFDRTIPIQESRNKTKCFKVLKRDVLDFYNIQENDFLNKERIVYRLKLGERERVWGTLTLSDSIEDEVVFTPYLYDPNHTIYPVSRYYPNQQDICAATCLLLTRCCK